MGNLDAEDWSIVGYSRNPVPGTESEITILSGRYGTLSRSFADMAQSINKITNNSSSFSGEWIDGFVEKTKNLPTDFENFSNGFDEVKNALNSWATKLPQYQADAKSALEIAKNAINEKNSNNSNLNAQKQVLRDAKKAIRDIPDDASESVFNEARQRRDNAQALLDTYKRNVANANDDLNDAKRRVQQIKEDYDAAGDEIADKIKSAKSVSPHVNIFSKIYYSDAWRIFIKIVSFVSAILAIVALLTTNIPLLIAGIVVSLILLLDKTLGLADGDVSFKEWLGEAVLTALSVIPAIKDIKTLHAGGTVSTLLSKFKGGWQKFKNSMNVPNGKLKNIGKWLPGGIKRVLTSDVKRYANVRKSFIPHGGDFGKAISKTVSQIKSWASNHTVKFYITHTISAASKNGVGPGFKATVSHIKGFYDNYTKSDSTSGKVNSWARFIFPRYDTIYSNVSDVFDKFKKAKDSFGAVQHEIQ